MKGLVSVIIPVYNRENVVAEAVQSVLNQTYTNFEILIIDDGSQDNTPIICRELSEKDGRIKFFSTEHGGVSVARNKGLDMATGEFVFFIDSDDYIHPSLIESLISFMERDNSQIAACDSLKIRNKNWAITLASALEDSTENIGEFKKSEEAIDDFFRGKSPFKTMGAFMIRREFMGDTRFETDLFIGEDFYFMYENLIKNASCTFLKPKRYYSRLHEHNVSWDYSFAAFYTRFKRRMLVWKSEEALGRMAYADIQKRDAFSCASTCLMHNTPYSRESRNIRKTLKKYKHLLFPAFSGKNRLLWHLLMHFPFTYKLYTKSKRKFK